MFEHSESKAAAVAELAVAKMEVSNLQKNYTSVTRKIKSAQVG